MSKLKFKIRKADTVVIIAGKDRGKKGKVISVDPTSARVVVEGVNLCTKRIKPNVNNPQGRIEKVEASIHISNVMLFDPNANKPSRVGFRVLQDGKKVKYFKKSNQEVKEVK